MINHQSQDSAVPKRRWLSRSFQPGQACCVRDQITAHRGAPRRKSREFDFRQESLELLIETGVLQFDLTDSRNQTDVQIEADFFEQAGLRPGQVRDLPRLFDRLGYGK